jgi:hypothetical protein
LYDFKCNYDKPMWIAEKAGESIRDAVKGDE